MDARDIMRMIKESIEETQIGFEVKITKRGLLVTSDDDEFLIPRPIDLGEDDEEEDSSDDFDVDEEEEDGL